VVRRVTRSSENGAEHTILRGRRAREWPGRQVDAFASTGAPRRKYGDV